MLFFFACLSKHVTYITLNAAPLLTVQVRYISNLEQKWYRGLLSSLSFTPPPRADFFFNFQTWFQKHLWKHIRSSVLFFSKFKFWGILFVHLAPAENSNSCDFLSLLSSFFLSDTFMKRACPNMAPDSASHVLQKHLVTVTPRDWL